MSRRWLGFWAGFVTFIGTIYATSGRLGFNPTDEGLVLAGSYRILHGQVPHADFVSPRPAGSAVLHVLDFLLPGPLFEVSRLICLVEIAAFSVLLASLILRRGPARWSATETVAVLGSALVNVNVFHLFAWHTVDGLLLTAGGLVLVDRAADDRHPNALYLGFVLLGAATLVKQSFALAPVLGWLRSRGRRCRSGKENAALVLATAAPIVAYLGWVAAAGGLHPLVVQLTHARAASGAPLIGHGAAIPVGIFVGALTATVPRGERWRTAVCGFTTLLLVGLPLGQRFRYGPGWGVALLWATATFAVVTVAFRRRVDRDAWTLVALGWMTSLSWGAPFPNLIAGSLLLLLITRAWNSLTLVRFTGAVAVVAAVAFAVIQTRQQSIYRDRPRAELTASLKPVSDRFGGITTSPTTFKFLEDLTSCVRRYPARWVAVLPDSPAAYPALRLRNPFPSDWMLPLEIKGSEGRLLETASELNRRGDYLVLLGPVDPGAALHDARPAPRITDESPHRCLRRAPG